MYVQVWPEPGMNDLSILLALSLLEAIPSNFDSFHGPLFWN